MLRNEMKNMFLLIVNKRRLLGLTTFLFPLAVLAQSQYDYYDDDAVVGGADIALSGLIIIFVIVAVAIALLFIVFVIAKVYYWLNPEADPKYKSRFDNNEIKPDNYLYEPVYKENKAYIPVDFDYKNPADIQKYINQLKKDYELTKATSEDWEDKVIDWGQHADEEHEIWDRGEASYSKDGRKFLIYEDKLERYFMKRGVEIICDNAFSFTHDDKFIDFPNSLKVMGNSVFSRANMKRFDIPSSVVKITGNPFVACTIGLKCLSSDFVFENGILYDKRMIRIISVMQYLNMIVYDQTISISDNVKIIGRYSFREISCGAVIIPNSVVFIGEFAFSYSNIKRIEVGKNVCEIETGAFKGARISTIQLPNSVKCIGPSAFEDCNHLKSIKLSSSLSLIDERTFKDCSELNDVVVHEGVTIIKKNAFYWCAKLAKIHFPNSLELIEKDAFSQCALSEVVIPKHTIVEEGAFMQSCRIIRKE